LALAGRLDEARGWHEGVYRTAPNYRVADFLRSMQSGADGEKLFRQAARLIGMK
jgi:hypothetical protein